MQKGLFLLFLFFFFFFCSGSFRTKTTGYPANKLNEDVQLVILKGFRLFLASIAEHSKPTRLHKK